jgi:hypothetical protein
MWHHICTSLLNQYGMAASVGNGPKGVFLGLPVHKACIHHPADGAATSLAHYVDASDCATN